MRLSLSCALVNNKSIINERNDILLFIIVGEAQFVDEAEGDVSYKIDEHLAPKDFVDRSLPPASQKDTQQLK